MVFYIFNDAFIFFVLQTILRKVSEYNGFTMIYFATIWQHIL